MKPTSFKSIDELRNFLRTGWSSELETKCAKKPSKKKILGIGVSHETVKTAYILPKFGSTVYRKPHKIDHERVAAIKMEARTDIGEIARVQASRIRNIDKALRRAWAAMEMVPRSEEIASAFYARYLTLLSSS